LRNRGIIIFINDLIATIILFITGNNVATCWRTYMAVVNACCTLLRLLTKFHNNNNNERYCLCFLAFTANIIE